MNITIGHLYYDILNLYGESGNVLALKHALEQQGINVHIKELTITDDLDFTDLDFIYIGSGTEANQLIALKHLKKYAATFSQEILKNKPVLVTGNSIELFGSAIINKEEQIDALGIFNYYTEKTDKRLVAECVFKCKEVNELIIGFENHQGVTRNNESYLFNIIQGYSDEKNKGIEGYTHNNFWGTYLIGPILARNPNLLEYWSKKILLNKFRNFEFKKFNLEIPQIAHDKFIEKYINITNSSSKK